MDSLPVAPPLPDHEEDGGVDLVQAGPPLHQRGVQGQGRLGHGAQHHPQVTLVTGQLQPPLQVPALHSTGGSQASTKLRGRVVEGLLNSFGCY